MSRVIWFWPKVAFRLIKLIALLIPNFHHLIWPKTGFSPNKINGSVVFQLSSLASSPLAPHHLFLISPSFPINSSP
jgi:hypothetical protein